MAAIDTAWVIGWAVGGVVVVIAAVLLLTIVALARRVEDQANAITRALDGGRENTAPLFDLPRTNLAIDRITRALAQVRENGGSR